MRRLPGLNLQRGGLPRCCEHTQAGVQLDRIVRGEGPSKIDWASADASDRPQLRQCRRGRLRGPGERLHLRAGLGAGVRGCDQGDRTDRPGQLLH